MPGEEERRYLLEAASKAGVEKMVRWAAYAEDLDDRTRLAAVAVLRTEDSDDFTRTAVKLLGDADSSTALRIGLLPAREESGISAGMMMWLHP